MEDPLLQALELRAEVVQRLLLLDPDEEGLVELVDLLVQLTQPHDGGLYVSVKLQLRVPLALQAPRGPGELPLADALGLLGPSPNDAGEVAAHDAEHELLTPSVAAIDAPSEVAEAVLLVGLDLTHEAGEGEVPLIHRAQVFSDLTELLDRVQRQEEERPEQEGEGEEDLGGERQPQAHLDRSPGRRR